MNGKRTENESRLNGIRTQNESRWNGKRKQNERKTHGKRTKNARIPNAENELAQKLLEIESKDSESSKKFRNNHEIRFRKS